MKINQNLSRLEGKKDNNVNCHHGVLNKGHAERVGGAPRTSASSTHAVMPLKQQRYAWKIPNQVWNDLMITTTRVGSRLGVNLTLPKEAQLYPRTLRAARRSGMTTWGKPSRMTNDASGFNHSSLVTPQGFYAGYSEGKRGFTLIELLVVVLIIGILAAVALPQYNKAVLKAQSRNLLVLMENIRRAEEVYYLENNIYTTKWAELPIKIPSSEWNISLYENSVLSNPSKYPGVSVYFFFKNTSHIWAGKRECHAAMNKPKANQFCQAMADRTTPNTNNGPNTVNIYHIP